VVGLLPDESGAMTPEGGTPEGGYFEHWMEALEEMDQMLPQRARPPCPNCGQRELRTQYIGDPMDRIGYVTTACGERAPAGPRSHRPPACCHSVYPGRSYGPASPGSGRPRTGSTTMSSTNSKVGPTRRRPNAKLTAEQAAPCAERHENASMHQLPTSGCSI
jgi:hypothetical protein